MRKIIGAAFVSLDGVMQAPGGPTEDPTGQFTHGGWLPNYSDEVVGQKIGELFARPFDLLLGRRTYDIFAAFWPYAEGDDKPMGQLFDGVRKYVVTRGNQPLSWQNSHRVAGIQEIAGLRNGDGPDLVIQGSSTLYPQLLAAGLLDQLILMTFPVVLGNGKKLFGPGTPSGAMRIIDQKITPKGNVIATYQPDGPVSIGTYLNSLPSEAESRRREAMAKGIW